MKVLSLKEVNNIPVYIALGFFDCVHLGHKALIDSAVKGAREFGCGSAVFTFSNNPRALIRKSEKLIFSFEERLLLLRECGADCVIFADFDREFSEIPPEKFLEMLSRSVDVKGIVCGTDYKFGKNALGDCELLKLFCSKNGIMCDIVQQIEVDSVKISSTIVRNKLIDGDVEAARRLLGHPYFAVGKVCHGRGVGRLYDFPTANITYPVDKLMPKHGVYATNTHVDGKVYKSVTNVGSKPTFDEQSESVETMLIGFCGDLYGKEIKIDFVKKLRDIQKFETPQALKAQIYTDAEWRI